MDLIHLLKSDFITYIDDTLIFDLDFTKKKSSIDDKPLEAGGQVFRSVIAFIGRLAIQYPQENFIVKLLNIRKGRKPKTGMRQQHMECVIVLKYILGSCKRIINTSNDFKEDSEVLTIIFDKSPLFNLVNLSYIYEFGVGKINLKTQKPSEEAASLVMQTWLMLIWNLFENQEWNITIGGGLNMSWSPTSEFCETVLSEITGFNIKSTYLSGRTGIISIDGQQNVKMPNLITSHYLLDQVIFMVAYSPINTQITYKCEISNHTRSQIYLWESLLEVKFEISENTIKIS